jgi:Icc-related predicted phosphoesterase
MKIIATADLHGNIKLYKELAILANEMCCDAVVICGDMLPKSFVLTFKDLVAAQYSSEEKIDKVLGKIKCPVIYIPGNDDWADINLDNGICIDGKKFSIGGVTFIGFPYVHITPFNTNREYTEQQLNEAISSQYKELGVENIEPLVIVAHGPIKNHRDKVHSGDNVGSESIAKFVSEKSPLIYDYRVLPQMFIASHREIISIM